MTQEERDSFLLADDDTLFRQCEFIMQKGTGNGGQKINKTSSAVRLAHRPTGIAVAANEQRSQSQNRHIALRKLRFAIAVGIRCVPAPGASFSFEPIPSASNPLRFNIWAAHLLDIAVPLGCDLKLSAAALGVSPSKLDKTLRKSPPLYREWSRFAKSLASQQEPPPEC